MKRCEKTSTRLVIRALMALAIVSAATLIRGDQIEIQLDAIEDAPQLVDEGDPAPHADTEDEEDIAGEFPAGAGLKIDAEMESLLKRAEQFVGDERYDLATILWQRVLDESGQTVMTRPQWKYRSFDRRYRIYKSLSEEIESTIAALPDLGLRQYRLSADGEAHAILAAGTGANREQALSDVVRLYFISSLGDDAAYELACLRLDRHDFVGAARLLSRILNDYPNPSVPRGELLLRLSLANARLGDAAAARSTLAELERTSGSAAFARVAEIIKAEADDGAAAAAQVASADGWPLPLGGPERTGHMKSLPSSVTADTLSEAWFENYEIDSGEFTTGVGQMQQKIMFGGGGLWAASRSQLRGQPGQPLTREALLARWKSSGWMPAGQMLLHEGLVFYKRHDRVVCRDAQTGKLKWMSRPSIYQPPAIAQWMVNMRRSYGQNITSDLPTAPLEAVIFGDRLHQAMTISDGLLLTVDGPLEGETLPTPTNQQPVRFNNQSVPRRTRTNYLSAYDLANGKFKWVRPADGGAGGGKFEIGYMAAPVPYAKFLLVPVSDSGAISMHAIDKATGQLVWKTFLCEDPISGANPYSPIGVAVSGGDAYVATGGGVVFALDAMSGSVRWVVRYQRNAKGNPNLARYGNALQQLRDIDGWDEDVVIPHGRALVVLASDSDKLFAVDRRSGELLWESPRKPTGDDDAAMYCLGVLGDGLMVAGKRSVRRYDLSKDGRLMWEAKFDASYGRGVLTGDAIYMPVGESIARIDTQTGKLTAQVGVFSPTKEPVGNLFSDGTRLLSIGMARSYSLQDLQTRMQSLARRIEAGDADAHLERMRLHLRGKKYDDALADLQAARTLLLKQQGAGAANETLYDGLSEIELISRGAPLALSLITAAEADTAAAVEQSKISAEQLESLHSARDGLLFSALYKIHKEEIVGAAEQVLAAAEIVEKPNLVNAARRALQATVRADDVDRIKDALANDNARVRVVAMAGVAKAFGDEAAAPLVGLLDDASDEVKLSAGVALANLGDRRSLTALGDLLESEDLQVRSRAVQSLRALTGQRFKFLAYEKPENRVEAAKAWHEWLAASGETAELKFPIGDSAVMLGRTLVAFYSQNRVVEYDADKKVVWQLDNIQQPWGADGLPNGHRLIASYNGQFVAEYDENGKEVWKMTGLPGYASHAHRLDDGNTLIACSNNNKVIEVSPDKKVVWEAQVNGNPQDARRLENGNTLVALQSAHKIVEIDRGGKIVWEVTGMQGAFAARRLDNGNTIVALSGNGQVVEVDRDKKIVWRQTGLSSPYDAQRLDNGNTLIVDSQGYREVDPDNKILWHEQQNGTLRIDRY